MTTESPERKLVERLRARSLRVFVPLCDDLTEAADTIERLLKERDATKHWRATWEGQAEIANSRAEAASDRSARLLALLGEVAGGLEKLTRHTTLIGATAEASALYERVKGELASCASPTSSGSALRTRDAEPFAEREP